MFLLAVLILTSRYQQHIFILGHFFYDENIHSWNHGSRCLFTSICPPWNILVGFDFSILIPSFYHSFITCTIFQHLYKTCNCGLWFFCRKELPCSLIRSFAVPASFSLTIISNHPVSQLRIWQHLPIKAYVILGTSLDKEKMGDHQFSLLLFFFFL